MRGTPLGENTFWTIPILTIKRAIRSPYRALRSPYGAIRSSYGAIRSAYMSLSYLFKKGLAPLLVRVQGCF